MERAFFAGARAGHDARNVVADNDCRGDLPSFLPSFFFPFSSSILSHLCLYSPRAPGNSFSFSLFYSLSQSVLKRRGRTHAIPPRFSLISVYIRLVLLVTHSLSLFYSLSQSVLKRWGRTHTIRSVHFEGKKRGNTVDHREGKRRGKKWGMEVRRERLGSKRSKLDIGGGIG